MDTASLWSIAGLMVLVAMAVLAVPLFWLTRNVATKNDSRSRRHWLSFALVLVVTLAAAGVYVATTHHQPVVATAGIDAASAPLLPPASSSACLLASAASAVRPRYS